MVSPFTAHNLTEVQQNRDRAVNVFHPAPLPKPHTRLMVARIQKYRVKGSKDRINIARYNRERERKKTDDIR